MIVSHQHKFIFVKTMKTAGSSLELYLHPFCHGSDIATPLKFPFDEEESTALVQNCSYIHPLLAKDEARLNRFEKRALSQYRENGEGFYEDMSAWEARLALGRDVFARYFKFCVVRNPFDRVISHFFFRHKRLGLNLDFDEYLEAGVYLLNDHIYLDWQTDELLMNRVARYETLEDDLKEIFDLLGIPFEHGLNIYKKSQFRDEETHYRRFLKPRHVEKIKEIYAKELSLFDYVY